MNPTTTNEIWKVFEYEKSMFRGLCIVIQNEDYMATLTQFHSQQLDEDYMAELIKCVKNALLESLLLHSRQLADILLSKSKEKDDITLSSLLQGFQSPKLEELRKNYGDNKTIGTPCWTINKFMAHPTTNRTDSYDYTKTLNIIIPLIEDVLREIEVFHK